MSDYKLELIESLIKTMPELTDGQLYWIQRVISVYGAEHKFTLGKSDLFDKTTMRNFGDAMRVHHCFSSEAFSKDKFEYVLEHVMNFSGFTAELAPKGNPGHDITVNGNRISLKTQADKNIKESHIWISKFMELGRGDWGNKPKDLIGLRDQFLNHLNNYERIFTLRAIQKAPIWKYELVEIPKAVLQLAMDGKLEMKRDSKQSPKPGYCYIHDAKKNTIFNLYFDGGGERKLQIKKLNKSYCEVHAKWEFFIPSE